LENENELITRKEAEAIATKREREARAKAFEEMEAECMKEAEELADEPFLDMTGAQHYARMSGKCKAKAQAARDGGEKP